MSSSSVNEPVRTVDEKWRPTTKQIIAAVIVVVALVAILQNTESGHFNLLWFDFEAPRWVWILVVFGAGVATGLLVAHRRAKQKAAT